MKILCVAVKNNRKVCNFANIFCFDEKSRRFADCGAGCEIEATRCKRYFWSNLLFINNFIAFDDECMVWTWSIAVEIQFYLISPAIVLYLNKSPKRARNLVCSLCMFCGVPPNIIVYHNSQVWGMVIVCFALNVFLALFVVFALHNELLYMDYVYVKPYTRIMPYLFGMLIGYPI